ncbi:twin-arginine translocation pathway signal protein [Nereida sp. MMG025]|uniref:Acg family FMN-binding oxidoreductase n=1 Tax=Nereida sp. MMG025 TaxID=2909981 RepID=UPI001F2CA5AA|nr:twin-arginine translocation pathway signal protein [Nereida sp. MMG025]MCF6444926.1 twin-arginine translocation pathway signal protein [Nereida sp. MMG025]
MTQHTSKMSRRKMLGLIGGGTIFAATASTAAFVGTRTPHAALQPWDMAGGYADPRMNALSYALLAPNPHNRQPWEAEMRGIDQVAIWRDPARNLPVTDPFARQLTIGMGCFLELMDMAAAQAGFAVDTTLYPQGEDGPVALCTFREGGAADPLFAHVMQRRSHKDAFDPTPVGAAADPLRAHSQIVTDATQVARLRELASGAWLTEMSTTDAYMESIDLLRIGKAEIIANPDGIDAGGPMLEALAVAGLFTHEAARDPQNPGSQDAINSTNAAILGAPAYVLTKTQGNTRADQIDAGRRWLRLNLAATGAGLAVRPVSQALQEYDAVAPYYTAMHTEFAAPNETVQMLGLLGYGPTPARTPRWKLETRLRDAT